jgi:hypothetical protein
MISPEIQEKIRERYDECVDSWIKAQESGLIGEKLLIEAEIDLLWEKISHPERFRDEM